MKKIPISSISIRLKANDSPFVFSTPGWSVIYDPSTYDLTIYDAQGRPVWKTKVQKEGDYFSTNDGINEFVINIDNYGTLVIDIRPQVPSSKQ